MRPHISRRDFMQNGAAACAYMVTTRRAFSFAAVEQRITIHTEVKIGTIRPELHGHFAEHLGTCVYGGLWAGKNSQIPNVDGYRKQAIDYLGELGLPVLRWPGGCFADDYHWRDGIGPQGRRPKTVNIHWGNYVEDNSFGTHEFIGLCRRLGAQPYLAGNVGSGTPEEFRDWVEYCNYPGGSTLSDERRANGSQEPFRVRYWGVGNENWGCGGHMTPEEYAGHYSRFATYVRNFGDMPPFLIACGPSGNDTNWSRRFFDALGHNRHRTPVHGFAMHFYSGGESAATKFTVETLQKQLSSFGNLEKAILQQRALLDSYDPDRRIGLIVDEWGTWERMVPEEEKRYGRLWQQNTMRTALAAGLGLNVFHRQADKLAMANIAQLVNVLQASLLADGDRCFRTPTYHAFALCKPHRSNTAVQVEYDDRSPLGLSISASRNEKDLVVTCVNPKHDTEIRARIALSSGKAAGGDARILHDEDFNACNTFEVPDRIQPGKHDLTIDGSRAEMRLPPLSLVTAVIKLG